MKEVKVSERLALRLQQLEFQDRVRARPALTRKDRHRPPPPHDFDVINTTSETIPAFGVMQVSDVLQERLDFYEVQKPNGSGSQYLLNGPLPIAAEGRGFGVRRGRALYTTSDGTPACGETWGPTTDWKLHKGQAGFQVSGGADGTSVKVWPKFEDVFIVQVWGNSGATAGDLVMPTLSSPHYWLSGRVKTFSGPGSAFGNGSNCWIYGSNNFLDSGVGQMLPMAEGMTLVGKYVGVYNPLGTGSRPTFIAQNPLHPDSEIGMLLSAPWTVTSDSAAIIPFDVGWPSGWADNNDQPVYADYSSGQHKLHLRWGTWGYTVGYRVVLKLPATLTGTQFEPLEDILTNHTVTVTPTLNGVPLFFHECKNSFIIPPSKLTGSFVTSSAIGHTHDVDVELPITISGQQYIVLNGLLTVDANLWSLADGSYLQLTIDNADDAIVELAELWAHSNVMPSL